MNGATIEVGDLVDAAYVANGYGTMGVLRGIVTGVGEWDGKPAHSVTGYDANGQPASTSQSPEHSRGGRTTRHRTPHHPHRTDHPLDRSHHGQAPHHT